MKKNSIVYTLILLSFVVNGQSVEISFVNPFSRAEQSLTTSDKKNTIEAIDKGKFKIVFNNISTQNYNIGITSFLNENKIITFDVINRSNKMMSNILIENNIPKEWDAILYKQALIFDWYSLHSKSEEIHFWGDPLIKLSQKGDFHCIDLRPFETIRVVCEFTPNFPIDDKIIIKVRKNTTVIASAKLSLIVHRSNLQSQPYASIIFNSINAVSGDSNIRQWQKTGFTHLQVNYIPTVYFDNNGNAISGINQGTSDSKGFRDTAYPWINKGGKILLFWEPRYTKLASIANNSYLSPFTNEWNKAFSQLLKIIGEELKKNNPDFKENQLVVYLADEVSSVDLNYIKLADYLKRNNPKTQLMTTFGFYSLPSDLNSLYSKLDIATMHFMMPKVITKNGKSYFPNILKNQMDNIKSNIDSPEKWLYNVESGINADIKHFRCAPMIGAAKGYTGFSWWAFISHSGSTWSANRNTSLNYSLYYAKEPMNQVHNMWTVGTDFESQPFYSSMRLLAAEAGLKDANLILYLSANLQKMSRHDKNRFEAIINQLKAIFPLTRDEIVLPSLNEIEKMSTSLREIHANL